MNKIARVKYMMGPKDLPKNSVYIGRRTVWFPESRYHNPFHVGLDGDRMEVLRKFEGYWYEPGQFILRQQALAELPGKTLMCWCDPLPCHGRIIAIYLDFVLTSLKF